ncbi:type II toxin-antitoxin system HipA family toxin [Rhodoferax saidenbachensis]|uniref:Phosphatidylinositol kinase n=1 Tax=Rhodoferax saidenbachensis TaxID=1484693 RepID=A0A1P8KAF5_9BURK|nr:type II toxin-antitoxin system HipA family toxin [Rhodoferax saidenbachensis]APW42963.1 phosphatidylinositol kinase [Rhodoferax saidenbachensis]
MKAATHLRVSTPQGDAGELTQEQGQFLFGYGAAPAGAAVSLTMPVRKAQYAHGALHPIFQMNLPEGFLLEQLQNRLAKIVNLEPMLLLALSGGQAPIGRVAVQSDFVNPLANAQGKGERLDEILAWDGTESLFAELVDKYIYRTGISGVQPKVLVPQAVASHAMEPASSKATVRTSDLIVKSGRQEYPGLAANEFLCMSIAKESGLAVPEFYLSDNKELFVMQRFDRAPDGTPIGFEDMAVLAGFSSREKYKTSYTHVAKLVEAFVSGPHVMPSLLALFDMVALSCVVGNGDAHLKNFGLLYTDPTTNDCRLAPAFDLVNTTAYIPEDVLALDLCGQKSFFAARQGLLDFAKVCQVADPRDRVQRLILTAEMVIRREAEVAESIPHVVAAIQHCTYMLKEVFLDIP